MGHFVTPLVYGALAEAAPDRVQAGSGMMNLVTFQGTRRDGRPFSTIYFAAGGFGVHAVAMAIPIRTPTPSHRRGAETRTIVEPCCATR
jgi:N-methylhydantoinase B